MSNLDPKPEALALPAAPGVHHAVDVLEARKAAIGDGTEVRRLLPQSSPGGTTPRTPRGAPGGKANIPGARRVLRTIGAWCFLDHYGPDDVSAGRGMDVPPHPHIGLQTASWLFDGLVLHRDSLGSEQLIRPGELNLMTAGRGIAHSEQTPGSRPPLLHGVQLWIALPREAQFTEPSFAHYPSLPVVETDGARVTVVAGEFAGQRSPAVIHTPLVGLEVTLPAGGSVTLATRGDFEYGVMTVGGPASVAVGDPPWGAAGAGPGEATSASLEPGMLAHLPTGNNAIQLSAAGPNKFFMVGGAPLGEQLIMWWNFVGRTAAEIASARDSWIAGDGRFAPVRGYAGDPLPAPPLPPGTLRPR